MSDKYPPWVALDTGTGQLLADRSSGVLRLTLNRPESRNALSLPMLDALADMLDLAARRAEVRVVLLRGAGGTFCAGGDLTVLARGESIYGAAGDAAGRLARQQASQRATAVRLHELAKPTLAAVRGAAVGAGLGLALACDLRYAGTSATLRTGFGRLGLAGDFGCTWFLRQLVGPAKALELLYLSQPLPAGRAEELGLVNGTVPDGQLDDHVTHLAHRLAAVSPQALAAMKQHVIRAGTADLARCADAEAEWHVRLVATDHHRDAVRALAGAHPAGDDRS
jgi:2-(1,2-epoxy-1,2-dihydrophenyl)acetyl-CoA isomerase